MKKREKEKKERVIEKDESEREWMKKEREEKKNKGIMKIGDL